MHGPKGIGAVYIARELQDRIEPLIYGGGQQNGLRSGTVPVPLCVGMSVAADIFADAAAADQRKELRRKRDRFRSEEHTSELQSLMRISYAVFCLKKKKITKISYTSNKYKNTISR